MRHSVIVTPERIPVNVDTALRRGAYIGEEGEFIRRYPTEATMKILSRVTAVSAAAGLALAIGLSLAPVTPAAAAPRSGPSPFCLMQGGSNGPGSVPETCGFFDYRQCLQAAAEMNANCVPNSDFRGVLPWSPDMAWRPR